MFSIFTADNCGYCDFDSIAFFDKKEIEKFRGKFMISVKNDAIIESVLSDIGACDLSDFLYGVSAISICMASETFFSFSLDGIIECSVENDVDMLKVSSEFGRKTISKHAFLFILKIILSEIYLFTGRVNNKRYENLLNRNKFEYILKY